MSFERHMQRGAMKNLLDGKHRAMEARYLINRLIWRLEKRLPVNWGMVVLMLSLHMWGGASEFISRSVRANPSLC
jgi:hypothetical protein